MCICILSYVEITFVHFSCEIMVVTGIISWARGYPDPLGVATRSSAARWACTRRCARVRLLGNRSKEGRRSRGPCCFCKLLASCFVLYSFQNFVFSFRIAHNLLSTFLVYSTIQLDVFQMQRWWSNGYVRVRDAASLLVWLRTCWHDSGSESFIDK